MPSAGVWVEAAHERRVAELGAGELRVDEHHNRVVHKVAAREAARPHRERRSRHRGKVRLRRAGSVRRRVGKEELLEDCGAGRAGDQRVKPGDHALRHEKAPRRRERIVRLFGHSRKEGARRNEAGAHANGGGDGNGHHLHYSLDKSSNLIARDRHGEARPPPVLGQL